MPLGITYWVYAPHATARAPRDPARCSADVANAGTVTFRQCSRRAQETIEGYGWCAQHAAQVRAWLARQRG